MGADVFEIALTEQAEETFRKACEEAAASLRAGKPSSARVKRFRMMKEALDKIIPHDPFHPRRALSGKLSNIFRIKKGRLRICYVGSSEQKRITVLFISDTPRKAGHRSDPYSIFTKLVESGEFDEFFHAPRHPDFSKPPTLTPASRRRRSSVRRRSLRTACLRPSKSSARRAA